MKSSQCTNWDIILIPKKWRFHPCNTLLLFQVWKRRNWRETGKTPTPMRVRWKNWNSYLRFHLYIDTKIMRCVARNTQLSFNLEFFWNECFSLVPRNYITLPHSILQLLELSIRKYCKKFILVVVRLRHIISYKHEQKYVLTFYSVVVNQSKVFLRQTKFLTTFSFRIATYNLDLSYFFFPISFFFCSFTLSTFSSIFCLYFRNEIYLRMGSVSVGML